MTMILIITPHTIVDLNMANSFLKISVISQTLKMIGIIAIILDIIIITRNINNFYFFLKKDKNTYSLTSWLLIALVPFLIGRF